LTVSDDLSGDRLVEWRGYGMTITIASTTFTLARSRFRCRAETPLKVSRN
jgi:hypothetical protein